MLRTQLLSRATLTIVGALLWATPVLATDPTIGAACSTQLGSSARYDTGNNSWCNGSTWQYPAYQFGASTATCNVSNPGNAGIIQWTGSVFQVCNGTSWGPISGSSALSALTSATGTNSIDNVNYAQTWTWNTLTTETALTLSSSSETSGSLLALADTNTASTGNVLNVSTASAGGVAVYGSNTATSGNGAHGVYGTTASTGTASGVYGNNNGTANTGSGVFGTNSSTGAASGVKGSETGSTNTGYGVYASNASTTGWSLYAAGGARSYFAGSVGIGTSNPADELDVAGALGLTTTTTTLPTNGVYLPSANQLALVTNGAAGVTIDGTASASQFPLLTLNSSNSNYVPAIYMETAGYNNQASQSFSNTNAIFEIYPQNIGGNSYAGGMNIVGGGFSSATGLQISGYQQNSGTVTVPPLVLSGQKWNGASSAAALTGADIVLGITPWWSAGSSTYTAEFIANGNLQITGGLALTATAATAPTNGIYSSATNQLALATNGSRALTITSTGTVGVGTTAPGTNGTLAVNGGMTVGTYASNATAGVSNGLIVSGNVGIGTNNPQATLAVSGGAIIGPDANTCTSAKNGEMQYTSGATNPWTYCNGSAWIPFDFVPGYAVFTASSLSIGGNFVCALTSAGVLWCWGEGNYYNLGNGNTNDQPVPVTAAVNFAGPWSSVSAGWAGTCGIKSSGSSAWCWGNNSGGQLGNGTTTATTTSPVQVSVGTTWLQIASGGSAAGSLNANTYTNSLVTCGVHSDNTGWCWGGNGAGNVGDGTTTTDKSPVQISGSWSSIVPGINAFLTCGLQTNGSLWCWGDNQYGELGQGTTDTSTHSSPVQITGTWTKFSLGNVHVCAINSGGALYCWGNNATGQIGDGSTTNRSSPVQVGSATTWTSISASSNTGNSDTCGLNAGTAYCWGGNLSQQLGVNSMTEAIKTPTAVVASTNVTGSSWSSIISGYGSMACGIRSDSTVYCWGSNSYGRLGDPNYGSLIPVSAQ